MTEHPITPPPPHLLKKFSAQARDERSKRNGTGYLKTFATLCIEWAMNCQATPNDRQIRSSDIQPPPELVHRWANHSASVHRENGTYEQHEFAIATQAARWGADQELEACCHLLRLQGFDVVDDLRAARRPKPPSLKEQALMALEDGDIGPGASLTPVEVCIIRRALGQLDD